ncbi:Ankyrin-2 [Phlyctochytrium bullatum]|nr:Ankyrin-2 [Phlyctochytrium bullatum]
MHGVTVRSCERVWGSRWRLQKAKADPRPGGKELWGGRVNAVRAVVRDEYWPSRNTQLPNQIAPAFKLAAAMGSLELLDDLCRRFPNAVADGPQSDPMRAFLWSCIKYGFADGLRIVPRNHPALNVRNGCQRSLLDEASLNSQCGAIKVLVELGAAVNPSDIPGADLKDCHTPLWWALLGTFLDRFETVKLLLTHGARLDVAFNGMTPLHVAVNSQWHDLVRLFLDFGPDLTVRTADGFTALDLAARRDDPVASQILLDAGVDTAIMSRALRHACKFAKAETVAVFLDHGGDVLHHQPPLIHAVFSIGSRPAEACEKAGMLLERGAPVDGVDDDGRTPLHLALTSGYTNAARQLLDAGADPTRRCRAGKTAFHFVAEATSWHGDLEALLDRLLEMGVELNSRDAIGRTALHAASMEGQILCVSWLLSQEETDLALVDGSGKGWLELAMESGPGMRRWLEENAAKLAAAGVDEIARLLVEHGAPVDEMIKGRTPLHVALAKGYTAAAVTLLDVGADARRKTTRGRTALHIVAETKRWDKDLETLLNRLLGMGVELNSRDAMGLTALHVAASKGRHKYLEWLLARDGIDVWLTDKSGKTYVDMWNAKWPYECPQRKDPEQST